MFWKRLARNGLRGYIIPANHNWFRDVLVSTIVVKTLEHMHMQYPELTTETQQSNIR